MWRLVAEVAEAGPGWSDSEEGLVWPAGAESSFFLELCCERALQVFQVGTDRFVECALDLERELLVPDWLGPAGSRLPRG